MHLATGTEDGNINNFETTPRIGWAHTNLKKEIN